MNKRIEPSTVEFAGFSEKQGKTKQAVMGKYLWNLIFQRDRDFGGYFGEISGTMGSGKTSLMLEMITRILKKHPRETIFWREPVSNPLQISKLNNNSKWQVLSERKHPLKVYMVQDEKLVLTDDIKIRYFTGASELLAKSKKGMVNVVYLHHLWKWVDVIEALKYRGAWASIFIDEAEDCFPQRCSNRDEDRTWEKNELLAGSIKEIRKSLISMFYNTQAGVSDVDSRIRSKLQLFFYCFGARYDKFSPLYKGAFQGLKLGECWIDHGHSLFGKIHFRPYKPIGIDYRIIPADVKVVGL